MKKPLILIFAIAVMTMGLSGCMSNQSKVDAMESRIAELEEKTNTALRQSAAAKVDAATALHISVKNQ